MPKIIIVSGVQLSNNPRVVKEADALGNAGFEVEVLASVFHPESAERESRLYHGKPWIFTPIVDNRSNDFYSRSWWKYSRIRTRLWRELYRHSGITHVSQLGYCGPEMLRHCLQHKADCYSIHVEQALWVGKKLIQKGRPVSVDFEDWYSEDLLPKDRTYRPVKLIRQCESLLHDNAILKTTTSQSLSAALQKAFGGLPSIVIPNSFRWQERDNIDGVSVDRVDKDRLSIFWFSQTVGPQRGLEDLIGATHHVKSKIEIHLRGNCSDQYRNQLLSLASDDLRDHVYFHGQVSHHELISRIAEHDIGFAGETAYCPSRDLTITNKVLQYLLAGIPQIASDTSGQREVAAMCPDAMSLYPPLDAVELAKQIDQWNDRERLSVGSKAAVAIAEKDLCWEETEKRLVALFREKVTGKTIQPNASSKLASR